MTDEENPVAAWTIKRMPVAVRRRATEGAERLDENVAEWVTRAVNRQADLEMANAVFPPGKPEANPAPGPAPPAPVLDLHGLGIAVDAVLRAHAAAGAAVPRSVGREARAALAHHLRAARGLPPRQTRKKIGQTIVRQIGTDDTGGGVA